MKISEYYDLPDFDPNNLSEANIKNYIDIIIQKCIVNIGNIQSIILRNYNFTALNMIIKFQVI